VIDDSEEAIARDIAAIRRVSTVPALLRVVCQSTGMGFAAVARVTDATWVACAVQDDIQFGLKVGDRLDVTTTLCMESRALRRPVVIDHASEDPVYCNHHTPSIYKIQSYISVPIVLQNGDYFGNLCAIDPHPARVSDSRTVTMFTLFAELISLQLAAEERHSATDAALLSERATAEMREQFIAVLGHDLRTPLNAVALTSGVLAMRTEPDLVKIGRRLQGATRRMSRLIEDLMDFARSRLGSGIGVSLAQIEDLPAALGDVIAELRDTNPGRTLLENIAVSGPVYCDRERVQQLLSNLLGNALTHGASDLPVAVDVWVEDDTLVLTVSNGGAPIAPENQARIFDPYWRPSSSRQGSGLGLGLYICSQIVKEHGGSLKVSSSAEAGTRFVARLPAQSPLSNRRPHSGQHSRAQSDEARLQ